MATSPSLIVKEIQELYLSDSLPWVIGYSGGKDSTASLQLIWTAIAALPEDRRRFKPIHVISTDTLVENPVIAAWVQLSLEQMRLAAMTQGLPIYPNRLTPFAREPLLGKFDRQGLPGSPPKVSLVHRSPENQRLNQVHPRTFRSER